MVKANVSAAFTEEQVAQLTGLTGRRLAYWDRTGFFKPEFGAENRRTPFSRVYSFRDLVSLRVLKALRIDLGVSLQHLREVKDKLSHLDDERWTRTTLYVLKKRVLFADPESGIPREIVSGQYALAIPLAVVTSDTREAVARFTVRRSDHIGSVSQNRAIVQNAPVVSGTRIPTAAIKRFHEAGYTSAQIMIEYPDLTEQDIQAALDFEERRSAA